MEINLNAIKEKITVKVILVVIVYLLAFATLLAFYVPSRNQASALQSQLDQEYLLHASLQRVIERRGPLTLQKQELEDGIAWAERNMPRAKQLPLLLQEMQRVASLLLVDLARVEYIPVRNDQDHHWITVQVEATGEYPSLYHFIDQLKQKFATLNLRHVVVESVVDPDIVLKLDMDFYVAVPEWEMETAWEIPAGLNISPITVVNRFGAPSDFLNDFYYNRIRLLGIVQVVEGGRALVSQQGQEQWKRVGDVVGIGRITDIDQYGMVVDVRGVRVRIGIGG